MLVDPGGADGAEDYADGDGDEHDARVSIDPYPRECEGSRKAAAKAVRSGTHLTQMIDPFL